MVSRCASKADCRLRSEPQDAIFLTVALSTSASVGIVESTLASLLLSLTIFFMRAIACRASRFDMLNGTELVQKLFEHFLNRVQTRRRRESDKTLLLRRKS